MSKLQLMRGRMRSVLRFIRNYGSALGVAPKLPWMAIITFIICVSSYSYAQTSVSHAEIAKSLVYIEVNGFSNKGLPINSTGTGFFISNDGVFITADHVISAVEKLHTNNGEVNITLEGGISGKFNNMVPVHIEKRLPSHDIAILRLSLNPGESSNPVCLGAEKPDNPTPGKLVFTSGFPANLPYIIGEGRVTSPRSNKGFYASDVSFSIGQSGSPVYGQKSHVFGLLIGSIDTQQQHYFKSLTDVWSNIHNYVNDEDNCTPDESQTVQPAVFSVVIEVEYRLPDERESVLRQTDEFGVSTGSLVERKCRTKTISPSGGWKIDAQSARVISTRAKGSSSIDIVQRSEQGLTVIFCARSILSGFDKKTGDAFGRIAYSEFRINKKTEIAKLQVSSDGDNSVLIDLPDTTETFVGQIDSHATGLVEFTGIGRRDDFKISFNGSGDLFVEFAPIE